MIAFRPNKAQRIGLGVAAALFVLIAGGFLLRASAERRVAAFLTGHGIGQALVFSDGTFGGGSVVLGNIRLDPDGDSTIGDIRATIRWPFLWTSRPFSRVVIDHLALIGAVDEDGHPSISGMKTGPLAPLVEADSVLLNSGRLDLATPSGDLQFSMKGAATRQPDGGFKTDAAFWGSQYQMTLDTRWQGAVRPDGTWTQAADVREMKGNLSHIIWSRANGWLKIDGDGTALNLKVGRGDNATLVEANPERFFLPRYVASKGWVGIRLTGSLDWDELRELVTDSYRLIAPARLAKQV